MCAVAVPGSQGRCAEEPRHDQDPRASKTLAELAGREAAAGRLRRARELLGRALDLLPDTGAPARQRPALLLELARVETNLGEYRRSLDLASAALALFEAAGDDSGTAWALFRIGAAHDEQGEYDASQLHYHRAFEMFRRQGDRRGEASALGALGTSYLFVGDPRSALRFFEEARDLVLPLGPPRSVCLAIRNVGAALEELGRDAEAELEYRRARATLPEGGEPWLRADLLFHLGRVARRRGRSEDASSLLARGLEITVRAENTWAEARIRIELALLEAGRGNTAGALVLAEQGAAMLERMGATDLEWEARDVRAGLLDRAGRSEEALGEYLRAAELLESVRSSIAVPTLRSRFTPKSRKVYEAILRLLLRDRRSDPKTSERTFEICERFRARTFAEMLAESRIEPGSADAPLRREEKELRAKIAALRAKLTRFAHELANRDELERELFEAERAYDARLLELRRSDPESAAVLAPSKARGSGMEWALDRLGDDADLVAYHLGQQRSFGWLVQRDRTAVFELPPRREIENLVTFFRSLTVHRNDPDSLREVALRLYEILLGPIGSSLAPGRSLVVVPDGALALLPFEALLGTGPAGGVPRCLVEDRPVSYAPSLEVLALLRERGVATTSRGGRELLAFGDPALPERSGEHRLVHAGSEVRRIASLVPAELRSVRVGAEATESSFRLETSRPARVIHLATHGLLDGTYPERSGLVFAPEAEGPNDGFLGLAEIFRLRLSSELVVLSGCETARGEILDGEGVLGLSRAFLFAGTHVLAASLWKVDDRSTEQLMVSFYESLSRGESPDRALQAAKIEWIRRTGTEPFDPFPWAAFVLIGDARRAVQLRASGGQGGWIVVTAAVVVALGVSCLAFAARRKRVSRIRSS